MKLAKCKEFARKFWRAGAKPLLVLFILLTAFRSAVADWNDVPSGSMLPTIVVGDRVFVNKLAYDLKIPFTTVHLAEWADPKRGDIVVFFSPADKTRLVKRVVGLPGDKIEMIRNHLFVNGVAAHYEVVADKSDKETGRLFVTEAIAGSQTHPVEINLARKARRTFDPLTVPPGHYFMMGDNRDNSYDSRYYGTVPRDQIVGKASSVVISLDWDHHYAPRWQRFFSHLL